MREAATQSLAMGHLMLFDIALRFVCSSANPVDENRRVSGKRDSYEDEEEDFGGEEMEEESDGSSDSEDDLDSPRLIREACPGKFIHSFTLESYIAPFQETY